MTPDRIAEARAALKNSVFNARKIEDALDEALDAIERVRALCSSELVAPETEFIRFRDGEYATHVDVLSVSDILAALEGKSDG